MGDFKRMHYFFVSKLEKITPSLVLIYSMLPTMGLSVSGFITSSIIVTFVAFLYNKSKNGSILSWIAIYSSIILFYLLYFLSYEIVELSIGFLTIFIAPFGVRFGIKKLNWIEKYMLIGYKHIIDALAYLILLMLVIVLIDKEIINLPFSEEEVVYVIIIVTLISTSVFIYDILYSILLIVRDTQSTFGNVFQKYLVPIIILLCLIIPDSVFSGFIYDLYLSLLDGEDYTYLQRYYYSFSIHFLTPVPQTLKPLEESLKSSPLGMFIFISHMLTIRVLDITVIAAIVNIFSRAFDRSSLM